MRFCRKSSKDYFGFLTRGQLDTAEHHPPPFLLTLPKNRRVRPIVYLAAIVLFRLPFQTKLAAVRLAYVTPNAMLAPFLFIAWSP